MGSDLYEVTVASKQQRNVVLAVRVVHPQAMQVPADKSFALMMLHESTDARDPLRRAVGFEDTLDQGWMTKYAAGFIAGVKASKPNKANGARAARRLTITVTDPAWLEHLAAGDRWSSRAFPVTKTYARCEPCSPETGAAVAESDDDGFMPVPTEIWGDYHLPRKAPPIVSVPAYGGGAYQIKDPITKATAKALAALEGQPVRFVSRKYKTVEDGVLLSNGPCPYALYRFTEGSRGYTGINPDDIKQIGRLELKPKARLGTKLRYSRVISETPVRAVAATVKGTRLELTLELRRDASRPELRSPCQVMRVLLTPVRDPWNDDLIGNSPIVRAVQEDMARLEVSSPESLARGYIKSFELGKPPKTTVPRLDTMTREEIRELFTAPRPTAKLVVDVTDAHWLDHMKKLAPFAVDEGDAPAPIAWREPPRRWKS